MFKKIGLIFLYWTWCLLQTIIGLFYLLYIEMKDRKSKTIIYDYGCILNTSAYRTIGVSLGMFIFASENYNHIRHEFGHVKQSLYLGPLYLPIIGLCSVYALIRHITDKSFKYRDFWCEKWATKLGADE